MPSALGVFWLLSAFWVTVWSCRQNGYSLIQRKITNQTALKCSGWPEDISSYTKLIEVISKEDIIGISIRNETQQPSTGHLCYWASLQTGLLTTAANMTGGSLYVLGKQMWNRWYYGILHNVNRPSQQLIIFKFEQAINIADIILSFLSTLLPYT